MATYSEQARTLFAKNLIYKKLDRTVYRPYLRRPISDIIPQELKRGVRRWVRPLNQSPLAIGHLFPPPPYRPPVYDSDSDDDLENEIDIYFESITKLESRIRGLSALPNSHGDHSKNTNGHSKKECDLDAKADIMPSFEAGDCPSGAFIFKESTKASKKRKRSKPKSAKAKVGRVVFNPRAVSKKDEDKMAIIECDEIAVLDETVIDSFNDTIDTINETLSEQTGYFVFPRHCEAPKKKSFKQRVAKFFRRLIPCAK